MLILQKQEAESHKKPSLFQVLIPLLLVLQFLPVKTLAAPFPGMGSSKLTSNGKTIQIPHKNFQISAAQSGWSTFALESESKNDIAFRFQDEKTKASLSVKTETLNDALSLETYSKKWIREYASFGFDLLGSKPFIQNQNRGLVIDLFHKKLQRQTRQVIFLKEKTSVIMTCTHDATEFQKILPECNSIIRTFQWN